MLEWGGGSGEQGRAGRRGNGLHGVGVPWRLELGTGRVCWDVTGPGVTGQHLSFSRAGALLACPHADHDPQRLRACTGEWQRHQEVEGRLLRGGRAVGVLGVARPSAGPSAELAFGTRVPTGAMGRSSKVVHTVPHVAGSAGAAPYNGGPGFFLRATTLPPGLLTRLALHPVS